MSNNSIPETGNLEVLELHLNPDLPMVTAIIQNKENQDISTVRYEDDEWHCSCPFFPVQQGPFEGQTHNQGKTGSVHSGRN